MKKTILTLTSVLAMSAILGACSDQPTQKPTTETKPAVNKEAKETKETATPAVLASYNAEQIEYARVWSQVIGNKNVTKVHVQKIPAGEIVNPYDETSATYPKDVIQLSGDYSVDGSVTYSSNGNGTINVYDIPSHWSTSEQLKEPMKEYTENIVNKPKVVTVDPGNEKEIEAYIKKLNINN